MKAAIIGALDIEHMGGGEANAVMISNLLTEDGIEVKYFGSGCPVDNSKNHEGIAIKFDYEPSAFSHDIMSNPFILRTTRLLSLGLMGLLNYRKTFVKVAGANLYYFQNPTYLARRLIPALLKEGSKIILANHGTYFEFLGNSKSFTLRLLGKVATKFILDPLKPYRESIIVHTQNNSQTTFYLKNGFQKDNILEIPQHNVDFELYSIKQSNGPLKVAFLGRLTESKGLDILPDIIERNPEVIFHIIGNGPLKARLKELVSGDNAILHGFVTDKEKRSILSECDAIIIPSYFESLSIAAVEGLASGLPIVGSETAPGLRHIIECNSIFGNLIPRTSEAFSNVLRILAEKKITSPSTVLSERVKRRDKAISVFDNHTLTQKLINMISLALEQPPQIDVSDLEVTSPTP